MKKRLLAAACLLLPLCGCLSAPQPEERAMVQAVGVDTIPGGYRVTLQLFDPETAAADNGAAASPKFSHTEGPTLSQAFAAFESESGKETFSGSCRLLVLGLQVSPGPILDYFNSLPQARPAMMVAAAQTTAQELLTGGEKGFDPARQGEGLLLMAEEEKRILPCRMLDLLTAMETEGRDGAIPLLSPDPQSGGLCLAGCALLRGRDFCLVLDEAETALLGMTRGGQGSVTLALQDPQYGTAGLVLEHFEPLLCCRLEEDLPLLELHLAAKGRLCEYAPTLKSAAAADASARFAQAAAHRLTRQTQALLEKLCKAGCDPLRFGQRLCRSHPKLWHSLGGENWPALLEKCQRRAVVTCSLSGFGDHR